MTHPSVLRLGTRGSLLARTQSAMVARWICDAYPNLRIDTIVIQTTGDQITDRPLHELGGKGLFIKELELALLENRIDFAVHSCKDVPVTMPLVDVGGLALASIPKRHDPRDLLISRKAATIDGLPKGATVATGSLRRGCQLLARRPDLQIVPIRGNIDTRINKLRAGQSDALILACAGVQRAGLMEDWMHPIAAEEMLPAPGQGALALQCRSDDMSTLEILKSLDDPAAHVCALAEREVVAALEGDCHSPIAALAEVAGSSLRLRALVGERGGSPPVVSASAEAPLAQFRDAVAIVHRDLLLRGARQLLRGQ